MAKKQTTPVAKPVTMTWSTGKKDSEHEIVLQLTIKGQDNAVWDTFAAIRSAINDTFGEAAMRHRMDANPVPLAND